MKKSELCNVISVAEDWFAVTEMKDEEVIDLFKKLKSKIPLEFDCKVNDLTIERSKISKRSLQCYNLAISHISQNQYGKAIHEIYDFIYEFGENLEEEVTDIHWMLLNNAIMILCFNKILK